MKEWAFNIFKDWVGKQMVSLSLVIAVIVVLTPSYNNILQITHKVEAQERINATTAQELKEIKELMLEFNLESNARLSDIKEDLGIIKYRINKIENQ